jgi:mono/diheme cytochrome c family protein
MKARASVAIALAGGALLGAGCGSSAIKVSRSSPYYHGAVLFREHCSGCHTLSVVDAQGSATKITNRLATNGPNFDNRKDDVEQVLYAIRNGGFSGAIMPENIVVGEDAQAVASFLAQYSGRGSGHSQPTP